MVKMFASRREADQWAQEQERAIRLTGLPQTIDELKRHAVGDIVRRYRDEITPGKKCCVSETAVLNKFLKRNFCSKALAYISRADAHHYVAERLKDRWNGTPITPRTVRREINTIQHVFEVAKHRWGLTALVNPFRALPVKGSVYRRKRRLKEGELERIERACEACRGLNRYYVPLAVYLAVETGMRLQEIFNLTWEDVATHRRIEIRKSKTDHLSQYEGRTIVLTIGCRRGNNSIYFTKRGLPRTRPNLDGNNNLRCIGNGTIVRDQFRKMRWLCFPPLGSCFAETRAGIARFCGGSEGTKSVCSVRCLP